MVAMSGTEIIPLKIEAINGSSSDVSHATNPSLSSFTNNNSNNNNTNNNNNNNHVMVDADNNDPVGKIITVVDNVVKYFPINVMEHAQNLGATAMTPPKNPPSSLYSSSSSSSTSSSSSSSSSSHFPSSPPLTATPITQAAHLLLCDEEVPLDGSVNSEGGRMGNCPPSLEKMVLGVLNNTLKSIVSSVSSSE